MADIENARKEINRIDREMSKLFEERMKAAEEIAEYKKERGLQIEDKGREAEVIARNAEYIQNEDVRSHYINFLQNVMDVSKSYQHSLIKGHRVAYSGVPGAFANIAANRLFPDCEAVPYPDFKAAFEACENGECDVALLPIENSLGGDVGQVMDLAFFGSLYINDVYEAQVVQNLVANENATVESIKTVVSHPQALSQCAEYIRTHGFVAEEAVNTAIAAKLVAQSGKDDIAAIASEEAAEEYGLKILASHINDNTENFTRFAVFSRIQKNDTRDDNRFILLFTVKNQPGSLGKAVSAIGENGFNLQALKSRPTKDSSWCYYFYVEGEGRIDSFDGRRMLSQLEPVCLAVKTIGSFKE